VTAAVLTLSACSTEKPSGLAPFTPSTSNSSPSPTSSSVPSPSLTNASKWTPEQQQVIDAYDRYNTYIKSVLKKKQKIDMAKAHKVAKEPFASASLKEASTTLALGFVRTGAVVNTISSVTVAGGDTAIIKTCLDLTRSFFIKPADKSAPVKNPPPSRATVSLSRAGGSWLVSGLKAGEGACVTG